MIQWPCANNLIMYFSSSCAGTPQGTTPPNTQSTPPQSSDQSQSDALLNSNRNETERSEPEESVNVTTEDDRSALDKFLPPPPTTKCSDELQEKITKFILLKKKTGRSFNSEVRNRKEYRNPDFLLHAVTYQDIDQIGSCFSKDVFDPHGYDKADYYDEIGNLLYMFLSPYPTWTWAKKPVWKKTRKNRFINEPVSTRPESPVCLPVSLSHIEKQFEIRLKKTFFYSFKKPFFF
ncbi:putative SAP30-binding protein [Helianthus annuus]|nr:putative SAP30-binding protein [Helianthus annuus]